MEANTQFHAPLAEKKMRGFDYKVLGVNKVGERQVVSVKLGNAVNAPDAHLP